MFTYKNLAAGLISALHRGTASIYYLRLLDKEKGAMEYWRVAIISFNSTTGEVTAATNKSELNFNVFNEDAKVTVMDFSITNF